ncbi:MAG: hypothetical protein OXU53_09895, partial [Deltaproteobacteria bacterium]|nr:hypothetical protein [Deltaproteobacteria bacterium]
MRRGIYRLCLVLFAGALFAVSFAAQSAQAQTAGTWSVTANIDRDADTPGVQINEGDNVGLRFVANGLTSGGFSVRFRVRGGTVDANDLSRVLGQSSTGQINSLPHETPNNIIFNDRFPDYDIRINTTDDSAVEGDETFVVETFSYDGSSGPNVPFNTPASITITILANDAARTLTVTGPASITETNSDLESGDYTVTLTGTAFSSATTVTWTVSHGTTSDADFVAASDRSGTVSFGPGDGNGATKTFTLTVAGDTQNESDETFSVQVSVADNTANGGTLYGAAASTTIVNDDADHSFAFTNPVTSITEGSAATTYTVTRTGPAITGASGITVTWAYAAGTPAPAAVDFSGDAAPAGGTLVFTASETSETFTVTTKEDALNEPGEQFTLTLSIAAGAHTTAADAEGGAGVPTPITVTIADDDPVTVAITRTSGTGAVAESSGNLGFTVTLAGGTRATGVSTTVPFSVGGSGITVSDYDIIAAHTSVSATASFVTIGHGGTTGTITLNISDDGLNEAQESLTVTGAAVGATGLRLSGAGAFGAVEYTSGGNTASVPITDNDPITVSIARSGGTMATVDEGGSAEFTVTLSGASSGSAADITVPYTVVISGSGYTLADLGGATGTLTITAGQTSGAITIQMPISSTLGEASPDQTVTVALTGDDAATPGTDEGPTAASGGGSVTRTATTASQSATVMVNFVDAHRFAFTNPVTSITEGSAATTYTVTRTGRDISSGSTLTVTWAYAAATPAPAATDFSGDTAPAGGTLEFTTTETSKTFTVATKEDSLNEPDEQFTLTLSIAAGAHTTAANAEGGAAVPPAITVTIADDDPIALTATTTTAVAEGSNAVVNVDLGAVPIRDVTVAYTLGNTAATTDVDATLSGMGADLSDTSGGSITITAAAGVATGDITVGISADNRNESAETFTVTITAADITGAHGTATIASGGTPTFTIGASDAISVSIAADDATVREGGSATFTVTLTGAMAGSVAAITVPYTVSGVTAVTHTDANNGSLEIAAGMTSGTITIGIPASDTATDDTADDTLTVTLTAADAGPPAVAGPSAAAGGGEVAVSGTESEQSAQATVEYLTHLHSVAITTPATPGAITETNADANTT